MLTWIEYLAALSLPFSQARSYVGMVQRFVLPRPPLLSALGPLALVERRVWDADVLSFPFLFISGQADRVPTFWKDRSPRRPRDVQRPWQESIVHNPKVNYA